MGYNFKGRLGCLDKDECAKKTYSLIPKEVKALDGTQITQISVSNFHTIVVTSKGKMFGWGENRNFVFGQIENDESRRKSEVIYYPMELPINKYITVSSSSSSS